jgi:hypothetical protein
MAKKKDDSPKKEPGPSPEEPRLIPDKTRGATEKSGEKNPINSRQNRRDRASNNHPPPMNSSDKRNVNHPKFNSKIGK